MTFSSRNYCSKVCLTIACLLIIASAPRAQTTGVRERIEPQLSPTPRPSPTPQVLSIPQATPTPRAVPNALPPTPPGQTPVARPIQTVSDLQINLRRVLQNSLLQRGQIGVKIVSLDSGKILFEENAEKYLVPASNMKSFTVAAALDRLTPDFRFVTSVYAASKPDLGGKVLGDLTIFGRGDPTFAASLNDGDYYKAINALADKIAVSGVKRIEGNLVGDESYFTGDALGPTWEWDDLQWYYGAGVSALTVNDNAIDLKVFPGAAVGSPCVVQILPFNSLFTVTNKCTTSDTKRDLEVTKRLGTNILEIRGTMLLNDAKGYAGAIAVEKPAEMFLSLLKTALFQKGITIAGQNKVITARDKRNLSAEIYNPPIELARFESPPLSFVAAKILKPSQNLYTELVLRALGEQVGDKTNPKSTSAERGLAVMQKFLAEAGIATDAVVQFDGSGLSRHNLITPSAAVQLYTFMSRHRFANAFQAALPIGAVDGTLKSRFQNSAAANNVQAKTGTLDQVSTLSGYVTTASGEKLVFSILTNNLPDSTVRRETIDQIVTQLANFNGKIN